MHLVISNDEIVERQDYGHFLQSLLERIGLEKAIDSGAPFAAVNTPDNTDKFPDITVIECGQNIDIAENTIIQLQKKSPQTPIMVIDRYAEASPREREEAMEFFKGLGATAYVNIAAGENAVANHFLSLFPERLNFEELPIEADFIRADNLAFSLLEQKMHILTPPALNGEFENAHDAWDDSPTLTRNAKTTDITHEEALFIQALWRNRGSFIAPEKIIMSMYADAVEPYKVFPDTLKLSDLRDSIQIKLASLGVNDAERYITGDLKHGFILNDEPDTYDPSEELHQQRIQPIMDEFHDVSPDMPSTSNLKDIKGEILLIGGIIFNTTERFARTYTAPENQDDFVDVRLTRRECLFLEALSPFAGESDVSRERILEQMFIDPPESFRPVINAAQSLRRKIRDQLAGDPDKCISGTRGYSYQLQENDSATLFADIMTHGQ